jgi:hypothetical protein
LIQRQFWLLPRGKRTEVEWDDWEEGHPDPYMHQDMKRQETYYVYKYPVYKRLSDFAEDKRRQLGALLGKDRAIAIAEKVAPRSAVLGEIRDTLATPSLFPAFDQQMDREALIELASKVKTLQEFTADITREEMDEFVALTATEQRAMAAEADLAKFKKWKKDLRNARSEVDLAALESRFGKSEVLPANPEAYQGAHFFSEHRASLTPRETIRLAVEYAQRMRKRRRSTGPRTTRWPCRSHGQRPPTPGTSPSPPIPPLPEAAPCPTSSMRWGTRFSGPSIRVSMSMASEADARRPTCAETSATQRTPTIPARSGPRSRGT